MSKDRFTAVRLPRQFPEQDIAEHEVFMAFHNDADALHFREWWQEEGAALFNEYLKRGDKPGQ